MKYEGKHPSDPPRHDWRRRGWWGLRERGAGSDGINWGWSWSRYAKSQRWGQANHVRHMQDWRAPLCGPVLRLGLTQIDLDQITCEPNRPIRPKDWKHHCTSMLYVVGRDNEKRSQVTCLFFLKKKPRNVRGSFCMPSSILLVFY